MATMNPIPAITAANFLIARGFGVIVNDASGRKYLLETRPKKVSCTSTFGCARPYGYQEIFPPDLLSEEQKQVVIDKVMNLPEVKLNSGTGTSTK